MAAGTAVKICGLQSVEVVKSVLHLPIDMVGMVFARSRRQVTASTAAEIVELLRRHKESGQAAPESVGVFVNPTMEELDAVLAAAALDAVQLHGQESPEFCRTVKERFPVRVIKAVSIKQEDCGRDPLELLESYKGSVDAFLLDAFDPVYGGGAGAVFDWRAITPYQEWARDQAIPLLIAGGLHEHNVQALLNAYHPDAVDVSSGVETGGVKDLDKITAFVERVKGL